MKTTHSAAGFRVGSAVLGTPDDDVTPSVSQPNKLLHLLVPPFVFLTSHTSLCSCTVNFDLETLLRATVASSVFATVTPPTNERDTGVEIKHPFSRLREQLEKV